MYDSDSDDDDDNGLLGAVGAGANWLRHRVMHDSDVDQSEIVKKDWDYWEHVAFLRRNLKYSSEWVSREGGSFIQGPPLTDLHAVEDMTVKLLTVIGDKDELINNMIKFHTDLADPKVCIPYTSMPFTIEPIFNKRRAKQLKVRCPPITQCQMHLARNICEPMLYLQLQR